MSVSGALIVAAVLSVVAFVAMLYLAIGILTFLTWGKEVSNWLLLIVALAAGGLAAWGMWACTLWLTTHTISISGTS